MVDKDASVRAIATTTMLACTHPSQDKIVEAAALLSTMGSRFLDFVEEKGADIHSGTVAAYDVVWLYATAFTELDDQPLRHRAARILSRWLNDGDPDIRESAANALASLAMPETVPVLEKALQDEPDGAVRDAITDGLREIGATAPPAT